mgnify:CR=1 FL=1
MKLMMPSLKLYSINYMVKVRGRPLRLRVSVGVCAFKHRFTDVAELLDVAERMARESRTQDKGVRRYQQQTLKPFGNAVGKLLRSPDNPRGNPDIVLERAGQDTLGVTTALVKPFTVPTSVKAAMRKPSPVSRITASQQWAGWRFKQFARVNNLLDKNYVGSVIVNNGRPIEPAPGRELSAGVSARFYW